MSEPAIVAAFRRLQAGDAAGALEEARAVAAREPRNARARLAAGIALRGLGRLDESRDELDEAARLDPADYAAAYELGMLHELRGDKAAALAHFERAATLRPAFAPARIALTAVLTQAGRDAAARGDFSTASRHFTAALAHDPANAELSMYLAQSDLLLGQWTSGWNAYRGRPTRRAYDALRASEGHPYQVPLAEALRGKGVRVLAEQGLGDTLFFLRFVPLLAGTAHLDFAGDARMHPLLARTGLFRRFETDRVGPSASGEVEVLCGDLPLVTRGSVACPPSLTLAPEELRVARWKRKLEELGPRPWTGITWRAGLGRDVAAHGLNKEVPLEPLLQALKGSGTIVSLQRSPKEGELASAARILGAPLHDLSAAGEELEDLLALLAGLDRHVGVSSTNMHVAALAGLRAEVLVPFPYEWRWGHEGDSPWFPGWKVLRQGPDRDWTKVLAALSA